MSGFVEVGDVIQTTSFIGTSDFPITRVTKTLAFSKRKSDGHEYTFKRLISHDMNHPYQQWSTISFAVVKSLLPELLK